MDEQYCLGPFGSDIPVIPVTVRQANNDDARISPRQHHSGPDFYATALSPRMEHVCVVLSVLLLGKL